MTMFFHSSLFLIQIFVFYMTFVAHYALEFAILTSWAVFLNFCLKFPFRACILSFVNNL